MNFTDLLVFAQAAPAPAQPSGFAMVPMLVFTLVIFYFVLIRPQQKRQKEHAKLVSAVKTGDRVVTNSGIHGVVANMKEHTVLVKIADNVKVEFDRSAIVTIEKSSEVVPVV